MSTTSANPLADIIPEGYYIDTIRLGDAHDAIVKAKEIAMALGVSVTDVLRRYAKPDPNYTAPATDPASHAPTDATPTP